MAKKKSLKNHVQSKRTGWKYEGKQYTGGRVEGRKNLKKLESGNVQNVHGIVFTPEEKKALEREVNKVNAKRKRQLQAEAKLERKVGGVDTGDTVASLQQMGKESDFIIARRSKSLQRFATKEQYSEYMDSLKKINSPTYIDDRTRMYKRNHMKAIQEAYGDDAKDVLMKIRMMKPEEYRKLVQSDENLEIGYIYDPSQRAGKLNQIRASLGMKLKDEDDYLPDPYEDDGPEFIFYRK